MSAKIRLIFIFFAVWIAVILLRMAYLASFFSENLRLDTEISAGKVFPLPALRGKIIGRNGKILVWSEKHYDLEAAGFIDEDVYEKLAEIFRERAMPENSPAGFIIHSLKVDELIKLEKIISNYPALHVAVRMQRCCIDDENVKKAAGTFDFKTGRASGGWELEFDHVLRGRDGSYRVMRDNNALVIKNSGEIKLMPVPGADVTVDYQGAFL